MVTQVSLCCRTELLVPRGVREFFSLFPRKLRLAYIPTDTKLILIRTSPFCLLPPYSFSYLRYIHKRSFLVRDVTLRLSFARYLHDPVLLAIDLRLVYYLVVYNDISIDLIAINLNHGMYTN